QRFVLVGEAAHDGQNLLDAFAELLDFLGCLVHGAMVYEAPPRVARVRHGSGSIRPEMKVYSLRRARPVVRLARSAEAVLVRAALAALVFALAVSPVRAQPTAAPPGAVRVDSVEA